MAINVRGNNPKLQLQPDSEIEYEQDGLIRAQRILIGSTAYISSIPKINDPNPDEPKALCYNVRISYLRLARIKVTASYIGIAKDPTDYIIEGLGTLSREPIETHPKFASKFGGKKGAEKNKAVFDDDGLFLGFPADAPNDMGGVESFYCPGINLRRTQWTYRNPNPGNIGKVFGKPSDVILPPNVKDMLYGPFTYRQVGRLFQTSEELLGSGENGWNPYMY